MCAVPRDKTEKEGTVVETMPRGLYKIRCDDGRVVVASLSATARHVVVRVIPGDRVTVEITEANPNRGLIKFRKK